MTNIYFARHTNSWQEQTGDPNFLEFLFNERAIGIFFKGKESWDPDDYMPKKTQGPAAIKIINDCSEGVNAYIFAAYNINGVNRVLFGKPKPQSKIFLSQYQKHASTAPIKMLFLQEDAKEVRFNDFPFVHLLAPLRSTLVNWNQCRNVALSFINGSPLLANNPDNYLPASIEVVCEEYLRTKGLLTHKLLGTGGTMKSFDIVGLSSCNQAVYAQVKNRATSADVTKFIAEKGRIVDGNFYFFSKNGHKIQENDPSFISIESVLEHFLKNRDGAEYLRKLCNLTW